MHLIIHSIKQCERQFDYQVKISTTISLPAQSICSAETLRVGMSVASSAGETFDFNLYLEDEPNKCFQKQHLFRVTVIIMLLILIASLGLFRVNVISPSPNIVPYNHSKIDDMNASFVIYRLKIDAMNTLLNTRVNSINETIKELRSEISNSNKAKMKLIDTKSSKIESTLNISTLINQIKEQSDSLFMLNELQLKAAIDLEEIRVRQSKNNVGSSLTTETQERITQFYSRIESIKIQQESMKIYQESMRRQQKSIKLQQSIPMISNTVTESHRMSLLKKKIEILEERISKAIDVANESIDNSDVVINSQYDIRHYDTIAETIISRVWDEHEEIYRTNFVPQECPFQTINDLNNDDKVAPTAVSHTSVYSSFEDEADFAAKFAGGEITYKETSRTYSYPVNIKNISNSFHVNNENIFFMIMKVISFFDPQLLNFTFGLDSGVGKPEDAISSDMSLGSCWPMEVS